MTILLGTPYKFRYLFRVLYDVFLTDLPFGHIIDDGV
jgi:hypothetical protein